MITKKEKTVKKIPPKKDYKKILDETFAEFIRLRDSHGSTFTCISCGETKPMSQCNCGHYIGRRNMATRFDEINCNAQCISCNMYKAGNVVEYRFGLLAKYGEAAVNELEARRNDERHIKIPEYKELIAHYKELVKRLKDEL